jgi:diguanylate cyclase (GGDEF)-like protein/PAS domain S-box-containing protein
LDNGELIDCNDAALNLLGYRSKAEFLPTSLIGISPQEQAEGRPSILRFEQFLDQVTVEKPQRFEWLCQCAEGKSIWTEATLSKFSHDLADNEHFILHMRDVTESRQAEEKMQFESMHDALTGLPNRRALEQELSRAIKRAEVNGRALAIGMIDLDGFKSVNDDLGHDAGDNLLKAYSGRMQRRMRRHDFLARLGGDEFVLLLNNLDPDNTLAELEVITERLKECTAQTFQPIVGKRIGIGMSMGVALFPKDGEDADGLLRLADHALLAIKAIKLERTKWWALADAISDPESEQLGSLEPYGKDASK